MPLGPKPDLSRPECRAPYERIKELEFHRRRWADRLQYASYEERLEILHTIEGLDNRILSLQDELYDHGCYVSPPVITRLLGVEHLELTQSIQYCALDGSGVADDNTVWLIESKPLLVRTYLRSHLADSSTIGGTLDLMEFNNNTLKYDILRRTITPLNVARLDPTSTSNRNFLSETLNFLVPADVCWGKVSFNVRAWFSGHESDPSGTNPSYQSSGSHSGRFDRRRIPVIHCFRVELTQTLPGVPAPPPLQFPAPSFADCQTTMAHAGRMFPVSELEIRDRGTHAFSGPLQTFADYDAVRADIQTVYDGTTPTPGRRELYVALLPTHQPPAAGVFASQLAQSVGSTVNFEQVFSHELGHWLLPGDDHVRDAMCVNPNLALIQVDADYPDYPNATQRAGIGEWGVDIAPGGPRLHSPETPEVMSYCRGTQWISPYNYVRAFNGAMLNWTPETELLRAEGHKLLVAFRLHRGGKAELKWALHLPGDPPPRSGDGLADVGLELYDVEGALLASATCHRPADRPVAAAHEDFQEVLPWFENVAYVVVVRDSDELARWPTESAPNEPVRMGLNVGETVDGDRGPKVRVSWDEPGDSVQRHHMLRYSPDDGRTWIPLANGVKEAHVDVELEQLRGIESARFQLVTSTGFRTTLVEGDSVVAGRSLEREVTILEPKAGARIEVGDPLRLVGATTTRLDGLGDPVNAYWSSNRDGFLAEGLGAVVSGLSAGRHVVRLFVEDGSGGELTNAVAVQVGSRGAPEA